MESIPACPEVFGFPALDPVLLLVRGRVLDDNLGTLRNRLSSPLLVARDSDRDGTFAAGMDAGGLRACDTLYLSLQVLSMARI
jgi:hypothetical protein